MASRPRRSSKGLPRALQETDEEGPNEPTLEEFVKEMHGQADQPQDGLPSLDWLKSTFSTKSAVIRYLTSQGFDVKTIAKHLGMRYQHVRNVAKSELKRGPNEDWRKPYLEGSNIPDSKHFKPDP